MDWSTMLDARIVVFGCGNTLFGDDGLAPRTVQRLAEEAGNNPALAHVAFIDAGTAVRSLLTDMTLFQCTPEQVILVDIVQEEGREAGSICIVPLEKTAVPDIPPTPGRGGLHHAPTWGLLHTLCRNGAKVTAITVQAAHIPVFMSDVLSPEAEAAMPALAAAICACCTA